MTWLWLINTPGAALAASAVFVALCVVPGLAVLRRSGDGAPSHASPIETLAIATGLSVALPPLVLLPPWLLGLDLTPAAAIIYIALAVLALVWRGGHVLRRVTMSRQLSLVARQNSDTPRLEDAAKWMATVLPVLIAATTYGHATRDLPSGLWGDSVHHTFITRLMADHGGLFASWAPYAPMTTFSYHYGFHANALFWHWLGGMDAPRAVLAAGNAMFVANLITTGGFAAWLARKSALSEHSQIAAGLCAMLCAGFVNPIPAEFINWGRYTQSAAQVIVPVALICCCDCLQHLRDDRFHWRAAVPVCITLSGLALTHYLVTLITAVVLGVLLLASTATARSARARLRMTAGLTAAGALSALICAPWFASVAEGRLDRVSSAVIQNSAAFAQRIESYSALTPLIPAYVHPVLMILAVCGAVAAVQRRAWRLVALLAAQPLTLLLARPQLLGLPGAGVIDTFTIYLGVYLYLAPSAGFGTALIWELVQTAIRRAAPALAGLGAAAVIGCVAALSPGLAGTLKLREHQLLTPADVRAMAWISANTPLDARFLVNTFPAYWGSVQAGNDAGWWLPLLSGRASTLPPIMYDVERGVLDDLRVRAQTVDVWPALRGRSMHDVSPVAIDLTTANAKSILRRAGVTHVYIGANAGTRSGTDQIDVEKLNQDPDYERIYDLDGARVYALRTQLP